MDPVDELKRNATVIRALVQAGSALSMMQGARARFEDEPDPDGWIIDNRVELDAIAQALQALGLSPDEPLDVPMTGPQKPREL